MNTHTHAHTILVYALVCWWCVCVCVHRHVPLFHYSSANYSGALHHIFIIFPMVDGSNDFYMWILLPRYTARLARRVARRTQHRNIFYTILFSLRTQLVCGVFACYGIVCGAIRANRICILWKSLTSYSVRVEHCVRISEILQWNRSVRRILCVFFHQKNV